MGSLSLYCQGQTLDFPRLRDEGWSRKKVVYRNVSLILGSHCLEHVVFICLYTHRLAGNSGNLVGVVSLTYAMLLMILGTCAVVSSAPRPPVITRARAPPSDQWRHLLVVAEVEGTLTVTHSCSTPQPGRAAHDLHVPIMSSRRTPK